MSYKFEPDARYRMPSHFGPAPGPRNIPAHVKIDHTRYPLTTTVTLRYLTEQARLEAMLPPGFTVAGEPIVSIDFAYMKQIPWLGGRGYNIALLSWPATFTGTRDVLTGRFAAVLFENFADPIITGRDELGHPKIYCEIPEPLVLNDLVTCRLLWDGFEFLRVDVSGLDTITGNPAANEIKTTDWLQWKYIPGTPHTAGPDASYPTASPDPLAADHYPNITIDSQQFGQGKLKFNRARWEDMPTVHHVANAFEALPVREVRWAAVTRTHGWIGDVGDTRRLS